MAKPRLTPEEHAELGRALAGIRDELSEHRVRLGNAFPRTGPAGAPARHLGAAVTAVDHARTTLEEILFSDHPQAASTVTYFPPPADRARRPPGDGDPAPPPVVQAVAATL